MAPVARHVSARPQRPSINHQTRRNIVFFPFFRGLFVLSEIFFHQIPRQGLPRKSERAAVLFCSSQKLALRFRFVSPPRGAAPRFAQCRRARAHTFLSVFVRVASSFVCGVRDEVHTFFKFLLGLPPPVTHTHTHPLLRGPSPSAASQRNEGQYSQTRGATPKPITITPRARRQNSIRKGRERRGRELGWPLKVNNNKQHQQQRWRWFSVRNVLEIQNIQPRGFAFAVLWRWRCKVGDRGAARTRTLAHTHTHTHADSPGQVNNVLARTHVEQQEDQLNGTKGKTEKQVSRQPPGRALSRVRKRNRQDDREGGGEGRGET